MDHQEKNRKPPKIMRPEEIPSMVGAADFDLIDKHIAALPENALILEFGPWLGAISARLSAHGELHAVDNFIWTADHAKKVPDLCPIGNSFRPFFERNLSDLGLNATVHEADFNDFVWSGRPFDLIVIDGPKTPEAAVQLMKSIADYISETTVILFKNALNTSYPELVMMFKSLSDHNAIIESGISGETKSNILSFRPGPEFTDLEELANKKASSAASAKLQSGRAFQVVELTQLLRDENWTGAYEALSAMPQDPAAIGPWTTLEQSLRLGGLSAERLETFSEVFAFHHGSIGTQPGAISLTRSPSHLMRAYWINNADKPWRGSGFQPEILKRALEFGYLGWPAKIQDLTRGKDILDVGSGQGIHGIGHLAAGAKSYLGVDPIIKLDKDKVKNLARRNKEAFGWTPRDLMALIEGWKVDPRPISETAEDQDFDLAILYDVTEHLMNPEEVFASIARRLRPDGMVIFVHHNYYSWNGHHMTPKSVAAIDESDPEQRDQIDWNHIALEPEPDHYISRSLNRIRLDDLIKITERYFDILELEEIPTRPEYGADRLTAEIENRYPFLTRRDFLTQNLHVIARKR